MALTGFDFESAFQQYVVNLNLGAADRVYPVYIPASNVGDQDSDGDEEERDCITYSSEGARWQDTLGGKSTMVEQQIRLRFFSLDSDKAREMEREYVEALDRYRGELHDGVAVQSITFEVISVDGWEPEKQLFVREAVLVAAYTR